MITQFSMLHTSYTSYDTVYSFLKSITFVKILLSVKHFAHMDSVSLIIVVSVSRANVKEGFKKSFTAWMEEHKELREHDSRDLWTHVPY